MTERSGTHDVRTLVTPASPIDVPAAQPVTLGVQASCADGCDLRGATVTVSSRECLLATAHLVADEPGGGSAAIPLIAPNEVGDYSWTVDVSGGEHRDHHHGVVDFVVACRAHETSLAVWDVKSPMPAGAAMRVKVGVTCSAACRLAGHRVLLRDAAGAAVGDAVLGEAPLPGTVGLYWSAVSVDAPSSLGLAMWSARFETGELAVPHEESSATFSFSVEPTPDHRVTVELVGKDSQQGLSDAEVRLGLYLALTDDAGIATFELPEGHYALALRKDGYQAPQLTIEVDGDRTVRVEAPSAMTQAEKEERLAQFLDIDWG